VAQVIVIEFVGLPASGKSQLAAWLRNDLSRTGLPPASPASTSGRRLISKATALFTYRRAVIAAVRALAVDSRPLGQRWLALRWLLTTLEAHTTVRHAGGARVSIQAEGVAQRALLLFLDVQSRRVDQRLQRYLESCPRPDLLIFLTLGSAASIERQAARRAGDSAARRGDRFDLPEPSLTPVIDRAQVLIDQVVAGFGESRDVTVVTLDASDLDAARVQLRDQVTRLLVDATPQTIV
jgi:hypothetical protein